ncbi:cupin domain-containing protein [Prochlorococcus sp. MIT 1300]|uniref:cupin domain-containing protein n=1 Tax=Prochlorococcus sp. MIT 1300 TaxID=3096218 RepID=UPI002A74E89F|nr:cupin domain-containing protein [Prochlorococcus sp. MIT 1300]
MTISITSPCPASTINELGIKHWPTWTCEPSKFLWTYSEKETCLILEGNVTVTPHGGKPVNFGAGDLVVFPQGMSCSWEVHEAVRKHYQFGN